ncbi:hypothetical protein [Chryseobacterium sp. JK1]|uniref:hypothetical protein n=1 Tax=Chryseobacterium sp. JK1 TaxID=874294 RepID=UPI003D681839
MNIGKASCISKTESPLHSGSKRKSCDILNRLTAEQIGTALLNDHLEIESCQEEIILTIELQKRYRT